MGLLGKVSRGIGRAISFIYPYKVAKIVKYGCEEIYTGYISRKFKSFKGVTQIPLYVYNPHCITVGDRTGIDKNTKLHCVCEYNGKRYTPEIVIGSNCGIGEGVRISAINKVEIGNNVHIAPYTLIVDNVHGDFFPPHFKFTKDENVPDVFLQKPSEWDLCSKGPVIIEDNVHFGERCIVLPGVRIGHNSTINAGSIISKNIPPYSIVSGNPAKVLLTFGTE